MAKDKREKFVKEKRVLQAQVSTKDLAKLGEKLKKEKLKKEKK